MPFMCIAAFCVHVLFEQLMTKDYFTQGVFILLGAFILVMVVVRVCMCVCMRCCARDTTHNAGSSKKNKDSTGNIRGQPFT